MWKTLTLRYKNWQKSRGKREGLSTEWHDNGQKSREQTYLNGTETSVTEWDENGNQITR